MSAGQAPRLLYRLKMPVRGRPAARLAVSVAAAVMLSVPAHARTDSPGHSLTEAPSQWQRADPGELARTPSLVQQAADAMNEGRLHQAVAILTAIEQELTQSGDRSPASLGLVLAARASTLGALGEHERALQDRLLVVGLAREVLGDSAPHTLTVVLDLAKTLQELGRWPESTAWLNWALTLREPGLASHDELAMFLASGLARGYEKAGEANRGLWLRQRLAVSFAHHFGAGSLCEAAALQDYAGALLAAGLTAEALVQQRRAVRILSHLLKPSDPSLLRARLGLARIREVRQDKAPAARATRQAGSRSLAPDTLA